MTDSASIIGDGFEMVKTGEQLKPQRLIRLPEVKQRVGLSRASIYKRMSEGRFPKSRSLGSRCAVWVEAEIDDWITSVANR